MTIISTKKNKEKFGYRKEKDQERQKLRIMRAMIRYTEMAS